MSTCKVVLIFPKTGQDVFGINVGLPLGIIYLATVLKANGFEPKIIDERVVDDFQSAILSSLDENVLMVGISSKTGFQIKGGIKAATIVRSYNPNIPIVWGGVHPSLVPHSTIAHPLVDVVCIGEGEETIVELANAFSLNQNLKSVKGIMYKTKGKVITTLPRPLIVDLDTLPILDFDLISINDYITLGHIMREPQLQLCTSRGCVYRCGYCYNLLFNKGKFRYKSAGRTFDEIKMIHDKYSIKSVFFYDDYFFGNYNRVEKLLNLLENADFSMEFEVSCRVDFLHRASEKFLARIRDCGFKELLIGVESGNDEILKLIRKGFSVEQVLEVNKKLALLGISAKYSFMAGFPGETRSQVLDTIDLMQRLISENPHASVTPLGIFTPYPGTDLYQKCLDEGLTNFPQNLEDWANYNWVEAKHSYLKHSQIVFLNRLNVISRFFDRRAFERFGNNFLKNIVMSFYTIYKWLNGLRFKLGFFYLMPETKIINYFQKVYISNLNKKLIKKRRFIMNRRQSNSAS